MTFRSFSAFCATSLFLSCANQLLYITWKICVSWRHLYNAITPSLECEVGELSRRALKWNVFESVMYIDSPWPHVISFPSSPPRKPALHSRRLASPRLASPGLSRFWWIVPSVFDSQLRFLQTVLTLRFLRTPRSYCVPSVFLLQYRTRCCLKDRRRVTSERTGLFFWIEFYTRSILFCTFDQHSYVWTCFF